MKKGVIELQFNWVFILIAGTLILLLFVSIAYKQKQLAELRISSTLLTDIDSLLSGLRTIEDSTQFISLDDDLITDCGSYTTGKITTQTNALIFSPTQLKQGKLVAWTKSFNTPFKTTNFLYLTEDRTKYIIITNPEDVKTAKGLYDELPANKQILSSQDTGSLKSSNQASLIFINTPATLPLQLKNTELKSIVELDTNNNIVKFYSEQKETFVPTGNSYYIDSSTMLGAAISQNKESYECVLKKAFERTILVSQIYLDRTQRITQPNPKCQYPLSELQEIKLLSNKLSNKIVNEDILSLKKAVEELENANKEIISMACTEVY